jgi:glycosyltransferase involved in cell wall biosynthesis
MPGAYDHPSVPEEWRVAEWVNLAHAVARCGDVDVVHAHGYLYGLSLEALCPAPMAHTLHVMPTQEAAALARLHPGARITALSRFQWSAYPDVEPSAIVPHGLDPAAFTFSADSHGYLAYLGRIMPGKGAREAIEAARSAGLPIRLAGWESETYREEIAPLVDGEVVTFVAPVSGPGRDRFLGGAAALVYPLTAPEPFGLVMVEAMLCGTPVAGHRIGAVPEIVEEGVTGFLVDPGEDLGPAVRRALLLDRATVRQRAVERFGVARMVADYEELFEQIAASPATISTRSTAR